MATKRLYTLVHNSVLDGELTPIYFEMPDGSTSEKMTLIDIDRFTTQFDDALAMLDYFKSLGFEFYNSHFFIQYLNNHQVKRIPLIFSDQTELKTIASINPGKYKVNYNKTKYINDLIDRIKNDAELLRFLTKRGYISEGLNYLIASCIMCMEEEPQSTYIYINEMKGVLSNYKTIRTLEIGIKEYERQKTHAQENSMPQTNKR